MATNIRDPLGKWVNLKFREFHVHYESKKKANPHIATERGGGSNCQREELIQGRILDYYNLENPEGHHINDDLIYP